MAPAAHSPAGPYQDSTLNFLYNLLFCDDLNLFKSNAQPPYAPPFDVLFADNAAAADIQKIVDDPQADPRARLLACNQLRSRGLPTGPQTLLAIIVEVGLDDGLDVLASFVNGTARYINYTEKILVWETTTDPAVNKITEELFVSGRQIISQIGPWDQPRLPHPEKGNARISFLVSDGLYFGEGPMNVLFEDPMAGPALVKATELMLQLTEKSVS